MGCRTSEPAESSGKELTRGQIVADVRTGVDNLNGVNPQTSAHSRIATDESDRGDLPEAEPVPIFEGLKSGQPSSTKSAHGKKRIINVTLEKKAADEKLGMVLTPLFNGRSFFLPERENLYVREIRGEGALVNYNALHENDPENQLRVGDFIIAVNGVSGNVRQMVLEIQKSRKLLFEVKHSDGTSYVKTALRGEPIRSCGRDWLTEEPVSLKRSISVANTESTSPMDDDMLSVATIEDVPDPSVSMPGPPVSMPGSSVSMPGPSVFTRSTSRVQCQQLKTCCLCQQSKWPDRMSI